MGKVLHASGSGYFPFCITEVDSITEGFRGTLEQMMAIYWRVKKWEIAMSGVGLLDRFFPFPFNGIAYEMTRITPQETEENIVCSSNFFFNTSSVPISPGGSTGIFELQFGGAKKNGDIYTLGGRAVVDGVGYDGLRTNSSAASVVGTWSMEFLGGPITGDLYALRDGSWDGSSGIIMTISAKEYWSYGGTYNTTTGEPL
jgi:hypothetical protein